MCCRDSHLVAPVQQFHMNVQPLRQKLHASLSLCTDFPDRQTVDSTVKIEIRNDVPPASSVHFPVQSVEE